MALLFTNKISAVRNLNMENTADNYKEHTGSLLIWTITIIDNFSSALEIGLYQPIFVTSNLLSLNSNMVHTDYSKAFDGLYHIILIREFEEFGFVEHVCLSSVVFKMLTVTDIPQLYYRLALVFLWDLLLNICVNDIGSKLQVNHLLYVY